MLNCQIFSSLQVVFQNIIIKIFPHFLQGVTLDEVKQASEELRKSESLPDKLKDAADEQTKTSTQEKSSADKSETVVDGNISGVKDRLSGTSDSGLSRTATTDISSSVSNWRRKREEREEERQKTEENSRKDVSCHSYLSRLMTKPTKWLCAQRDSDQPWHPPSLISLCCALNG